MDPIIDQYRTIVTGAGWADRSARGRLRFEGADALSFLQALVTNDVAGLAIGAGVYAAYLTPQGRMLADLELYRRSDAVVADVAPGIAASLAARFDQLVFSEDVRVLDVSAATSEVVVTGGGAFAVVADALGLDAAALAALPELAQLDSADGFVARTGDARLPTLKIIAPADRRDAIVGRVEEAGAVAVSDALVEALRVEAARPAFGIDMTEDTIPLEAGLLDRAISTSKGCYVGQEVIVRVLHRGGGRVARRLATLVVNAPPDAAARPRRGDALTHDGRDVGRLTSVTPSPGGGPWIALGYVHRDLADVGRSLDVGDSQTTVTVTGFAA